MIAFLASVAMASVQLEQPGQLDMETVIVVQDDQGAAMPGQTVRVVYEPGLAAEREQAIGITDGRGRVRWIPNATGLAKIRAGDTWQTVAVTGPSHVDAMLLLATLLTAGALALGVGVRRSGWGRP